MKLNYKKDLPSKWVWWVLIILAICCFKGCASASSLNISDFDYETYNSGVSFENRNCLGVDYNSNNLNIKEVTKSCKINFTQSEWNNNFNVNNHNFLIYPFNHSVIISNINPNDEGTSEVLTSIADYTLKAYLTDTNNKIYLCDIVNDSMAMCRFGSVRISSITLELVMLNGIAPFNVNGSNINTKLYYQSQYYLTSYGSVKNSIKVIEDSILSDSVDTNNSGNNAITQFQSLIPTNGTITNLVLLPLNLVNAYSVGMSGTCNALNLGTIFGTEIILPCISMQNLVGSVLWGIIDIIVGGLMVFAIGKKMVRVFNDLTSLRDNQIDELYGGGA